MNSGEFLVGDSLGSSLSFCYHPEEPDNTCAREPEKNLCSFQIASTTHIFCGRFLYSQTLQSRIFKKVKVEILNNANLVPAVREAFGDRVSFDLWWEAHQISASTMFNIKITTHRIFQALLAMGSVVVVAAGFVIKSALSSSSAPSST